MRRRIIIVIIIIGAVAYAPWWFSLLLVLGAIWRFGSGYELLIPAILADLAYGSPTSRFFGLAFVATFFTVLAITLSKILAKQFFLRT